MSTIYVINPVNFEYNDNYYYSVGLSNPKYSFIDIKEAEKKKEQLEKQYFIDLLNREEISGYSYNSQNVFSDDLDEDEFQKLFEINYQSWSDNYYSFENKNFTKNSENKFTEKQIDFLFKYYMIEFYTISETELIDVFSN